VTAYILIKKRSAPPVAENQRDVLLVSRANGRGGSRVCFSRPDTGAAKPADVGHRPRRVLPPREVVLPEHIERKRLEALGESFGLVHL
jgi:hypothetical protein